MAQPGEVKLARHANDLDDDGHDKSSPWRELVKVATTASITISTALNDGDTLDGITLRDRDRVLVKNQSTPSQNGIYVVGTTPARATDFADGSIYNAFLVIVLQGTAGSGTSWQLSPGTSGQVLVGTDDIDWVQFGEGVTDHGALGGLSDDDHTQYVLRSILTTKGDLFARTTTGVDRVAVGTNDYVLTADSTASTGVAWKAGSSGVSQLDDLTDVNAPSPASGDALVWSGSEWVATAPSEGGRYSALGAPTTAVSVGHEFKDGTAGSFAWAPSNPGTNDVTTYGGWGRFVTTDSTVRYYSKAWTPGASDVTAALGVDLSSNNNAGHLSLMLGSTTGVLEGAGGNAVLVQVSFGTNGGDMYVDAYDINTGSFSAIGSSQLLRAPNYSSPTFYLRLTRVVSGPTWTFYYSFNGVTWASLATTGSKSLTIGAIALRLASDSTNRTDIAVAFIRGWDSIIEKIGS